MPQTYKNQSERYAYFMVLEGTAILLVAGLLSCDARVQHYLFGSRSNSKPMAQRVDLRKLDAETKPFATIQIDESAWRAENEDTPANNPPCNEGHKDTDSELSLDGPSTNLEWSNSTVQGRSEENEGEFVVEEDSDSLQENIAGQLESPLTEVELQKQPDEDNFEVDEFETLLQTKADSSDEIKAEIVDIEPAGLSGAATADNVYQSSSKDVMESSLQSPKAIENPTWWMIHYEDSLLRDRFRLRATLTDVVSVALQNSPQISILSVEPAILETYRLGNTELDATTSQSVQKIQSFMIDVVSAYWDVYLARVKLIQNRHSVKRAEELKQMLLAGASNEIHRLRVEAIIDQRRSDAIQAEYDLVNAQDILNNLTIGPKAVAANRVELIPDVINLPTSVQLSEDRLIEIALIHRPELRAAQANFQAAAMAKDIASKSLPFASRAAARLKRTELQVNLSNTQLRKAVGDVVLDVRIAARNVVRLNQEMHTCYQALLKASKELSATYTKLDVDQQLKLQARVTHCERRLSATRKDHAVALVDLKRATGELMHTDGLDYCSSPTAVPLAAIMPQMPPIVRDSGGAEHRQNETDFVPATKGIFATITDVEPIDERNENDFLPLVN